MKLLGRKLKSPELTLHEYQNLFIYYFIKENISKGSRILKIGKDNSEILKHVENQYECWELKNPTDLTTDADNSESISITRFENEETKLKNNYNYFDFVFSLTAFDNLNEKSINSYNIEFNLNRITKPGAYSIHNFLLLLKNNSLKNNKFLDYLIVNSYSKFSKSKCLTGPIKTREIIGDTDLFFQNYNSPDNKISRLFKKESNENSRIFSYSIILKKDADRIPSTTRTNQTHFLEKNPAYLFHHIPKCGGKSTAAALRNWFDLEPDHFLKDTTNYNDYVKYKYNLDRISSDVCLMGHYSHEGFFVHQRYPEFVQKNDKFRLFTFVREPFSQRVSRYYYFKQSGIIKNKLNLEPMLQISNNLISAMIPCDQYNYKQMLDRYFFIGITEFLQESLDKFAKLTGKKKVSVPKINTSSRDHQLENLSPAFIEKFKDNNKLDYMIYDYCMEKYLKT